MKNDMNTSQELRRTANDNESQEAPHSHPAWRAAFDAQCTVELIDDLIAYAARHASWIEHRTGVRDPDLAGELFHDALGDTFAGVVTWHPPRCTLAMHLRGVIRARVAHELNRAERFERISMEDSVEGEVSTAMAASSAATSGADIDRCAEEFERHLRILAAGDEGVLAIIELYREGITEKRDVCQIAKMKATDYHNAHRRLKRLVAKLPERLRAATIAQMG